MELTHLKQYVEGIFLIDKSDIGEIILKHATKIDEASENANLEIFENLFQIELEKIFQRIEHAIYHADEQGLLECHERLLQMTRLRDEI